MNEAPKQFYVAPGEYSGIGRVSEEAAQIPTYRTYDTVIFQLDKARFGDTITTDDVLSGTAYQMEKINVGPNVPRAAELLAELAQNLVDNCQSDEEIRDRFVRLNEDLEFNDYEHDILLNRVYQAQRVSELDQDKARQITENDGDQTEVSNENETFSKIESLFWQYELILMQHGNSAFATAGIPNENFKAFDRTLAQVIEEISDGDSELRDQLNKSVRARIAWTSRWYSGIEQSWKSNAQAVNAETAATTTPASVEVIAPVTETVEESDTVEVEQTPAVILPADEAKPSESIADTEPTSSPKELLPIYESQLREWADKNRDKVDTIENLRLLFNKQRRASIKQGWTRKEFNRSPVADAIFGIMSEELWTRTGAKTGRTDVFNTELPVLKSKVYEKPDRVKQLVVAGKKVYKQAQRIGYRAMDMGQNFIESRRKSKK